jgi:hypothetical protein
VAGYALANAVGDVAGILDTLGIEAAHVVDIHPDADPA